VLAFAVTALDAQGRRRGGGQGRGQSQYDPGYPSRRTPRNDWPLPAPEPKTQGPLPPIYLPGFDSPKKDSKEPAPVGPKPKAKPTPKQPPDPMKEADEITAAADHRAAVEQEEDRLLTEHFRLCDLDGGGWLSLREVEVTLSLDRGDFRRLDANQDGRIVPWEFSAQGAQLLGRLGALPPSPGRQASPPEPPSGPPLEVAAEPGPEEPAPGEPAGSAATASAFLSMPVRPRDLLARYDADQSSGLDSAEVEKLFLEAGLALSPELVVAQMDPDDSAQLEASELVAIAWMVSRHVPEVLRPPPEPVAPPVEHPVAAVERSAGLATHFGLLDEDADGFVDEADLRALQSPARLDLRLRVLLSAMDLDVDGRLSAAEFRGSMGAGPR
jgi:hypothetical protein